MFHMTQQMHVFTSAFKFLCMSPHMCKMCTCMCKHFMLVIFRAHLIVYLLGLEHQHKQ